MFINNKDLSSFGITVVSIFDIDSSNYKYEGSYWNSNSLLPIKGKCIEDFRKINTEFLFEGKTKEDINKMVSLFNEEVKSCIIKKDNLNYEVILEGALSKKQINQYTFSVTHSFTLINIYEDEKSESTNNTTNITINSPKPCYANLELNASTAVINCTIRINDTEIVVKNINKNETVYIGSGKVISGGKSKINDVEMWEFPVLRPGVNNITVNRSDVNLTIKYNERW